MKKIVILEPLAYSNPDLKKEPLKISGVSQIETDQLEQLIKTYKVIDFKTGKELKSKANLDENGEGE